MNATREQLNIGLKLHRRGELAQAADIYQGMLAREPQHADALHLLGVVALQQGNLPRAIELICRAAALNPNAPAYHCNLGEAYRLSGQMQRAAGCFRTALAVDPQCPDAANGMGLVLAAQGQPEAAVAHYEAALQCKPTFALARVNLGNVLVQQGKKDEAQAEFRRALEQAPSLALAHCNLGQLLLEDRQTEEAMRHCREAVRLRPNLAEGHNNLGNVFRSLGRLTEAKACYTEALRLNPDLAMVYNNLGQAVQEEGQLEDAVRWYEQALRREPHSARFHTNLASALQEQDEPERAVEHYETALRLNPTHAEAHQGLGFVRHEQGQFAEAERSFREALRLKPNLAEAHCSLGNIAEELGDFAKAEASFREALRLDPDHTAAYAALAALLRRRLPEADEAAMRQRLASPWLSDGRRCALHLGLGQVLDDRGEHAEAAEHLTRGKALDLANRQRRGRSYIPDAHAHFVGQLLATFTPEFFARVRGWGLDSERPVFVFGLPRSGTTLVEQILASHSQVHGAGELRLARRDFEGLAGGASAPRGRRREVEPEAFAALARLDRDTVRGLAQNHLDRLQELHPTAARVTDKMPDNYLFFGLLATLFPRAKFIHCRRDLRDIAVSCWVVHFRQINWASAPDHIASRFGEYLRVMAHWQRVQPAPLLEVAYEEAVTDLEAVARRLVAWCGLDWEPACLAFHETVRPVRTASVTQVRQPVYTRSVGRWKHYTGPLGPLFARLSELEVRRDNVVP
jgi:tetratricopeptide (TPR) repeat protein